MSQAETYNTILSTVQGIIPESRVLLFGSQAKGSATKHSDYDILVITKNDMDKDERGNLFVSLNKSLVRTLHKPFDIIINSEKEAAINQTLIGHVVRSAFKNGFFL